VQEEQPTTCVETSKRSTLRPIVPSPRPSSGAVGLCCFPAFVSPPFRTFPTYSLLWIELLLSVTSQVSTKWTREDSRIQNLGPTKTFSHHIGLCI
jgi:hypothetical protein